MEWNDPFRRKGTLARAFALPRGMIRSETGRLALWPLLLSLIEAERQARRFFLWLAPLAMFGALLYAAADQEPSLIAGIIALLFWSVLAIGLRRHSDLAFSIALALTAIAFGFMIATLRTITIAAPILEQAQSGMLDAIVETVDPQENSARLILRPLALNGQRNGLPERLRVKGPRGLHAGDHIVSYAHVMPPPDIARPGGYDFARDAYFQKIGGVGSLNGKIEKRNDRPEISYRLALTIALDNLRNMIAARITSVIGGQSGAVAAALITGKRGMISDETNDDLRGAGIYHVVSISGLHMVLAAGFIFFILRLTLSLIPFIALHWPVKQIAASGAMLGALAYNIFAGSEVATERSLVMTLFLFGAILVSRPALSMRNLAFSALTIIAMEPESVTGPSFQMSFAAVAALVAVFERRTPLFELHRQAATSLPPKREAPPHSIFQKAISYLYRHVRVVLVTTLIAEAATAPYAAFHFQRFQPLGLIGNALSIPLIELISMPLGFAGMIAMPFGLDAPFWKAMGLGVDPMLYVSHMVASLDFATHALPAISIASVLILSFGLLWLTLWSSALRLLGFIPVAIGIIFAMMPHRPDIYIARDGQSLALRMEDGRLHVMGKGASEFVIAQWLAADGDLRKPNHPSIRAGPICNRSGCIARLYDGRRVSLTFNADDLNEDCTLAAILVTPLDAPKTCKAYAIDQAITDRNGAITLTLNQNAIELTGARNPLASRPWNQNHSKQTEADINYDANAP